MKKLFRITLHADPNTMHDIMLMGGRGVEIIDVQPVRHGGEDERGQLQAKPTGAQLVLAHAQSHPGGFRARDIYPEAARLGVTKGSLSVAVAKLYRDGALKRIGGGAYMLKAQPQLDGRKNPNRKIKAGSEPEVVLNFVRSQQNGTGTGIALNDIRQHLVESGKGAKNVARTIINLVKRKQLTKVGPREYRAGA